MNYKQSSSVHLLGDLNSKYSLHVVGGGGVRRGLRACVRCTRAVHYIIRRDSKHSSVFGEINAVTHFSGPKSVVRRCQSHDEEFINGCMTAQQRSQLGEEGRPKSRRLNIYKRFYRDNIAGHCGRTRYMHGQSLYRRNSKLKIATTDGTIDINSIRTDRSRHGGRYIIIIQRRRRRRRRPSRIIINPAGTGTAVSRTGRQ